MMSNKEMHFDIEIITKSKVQIFADCQIALVKRRRGINSIELFSLINDLEKNPNNDNITINIRGVNW